MNSSSSDDNCQEDDEDIDTFPHTSTDQFLDTLAVPQMPQNDHLNAAAPGELSPPRSVNQSQSDMPTTESDRQGQGSSSKRNAGNSSTPAPQDKDQKPGSGWRSKRAEEEMQRAWDNVVDKEWDAKQYGDVMAPLGQ